MLSEKTTNYMRLKYFLSVIFIMLFFAVFSQSTKKYTDISYDYRTAKDLYDNQMYGAAQQMFSQILMHTDPWEHSSYQEDAAFYFAMCAIHLTHRNAEYLVGGFIKERPESYYKQAAIFEMANSHFRDKDFRNALTWFEKIDRLALPIELLPEYHFKTGFCHFARRDYDRAAKEFFEARNAENIYGPMSQYFYSHIKYLNKNYQTALLGFLELKDHPVFAEIIPFYVVQIYYLQGRYNDIIDYTPDILTGITGPKTAELYKMLGSSYFKTGKYSEAIPYLKQYQQNTRNISDYDNYELGFALYSDGQYNKAISYFSKIATMRDTLSQNAAYHMADSYLKLGRKNEAKLAFETASRYRFNENIRENALYNYALISFELDSNPFNEAINALTKFIEEYPQSHRVDAVYGYLVDAFWTAKNYRDAIYTIDKMTHRSPKLNEAYQRLTFYRGLELFTNLNFHEALKYFNLSLEHSQYNANIHALTLYWKAESYYRMEDYNEAIKNYERFINTRGAITLDEFALAQYNLGYAYFSLKDYRNANSWFRKFEAEKRGKRSAILNDALNRIGDSYYITRNFAPAAEYYEKSVSMGMSDTDYALYQLALSYGGQRIPEQKVLNLNRLISNYPKSEYAGNATFELARTYNTQLNRPDSAKYYFNKFLTEYPRSAMQKQALASLGSIYFNERNFDNSLECFKQIISHYPNTNEAYNAIEMIKSIYVEMNKTEEYFEYASSELQNFEITPDEQDSLSFLAAKNLYLEQKFDAALESLTRFLERFPNSRNALEATYYKAEIHFHFDAKEEAMYAYMNVADAPRNRYSERSTIRAAGLLFEKKDYERAYKYYQKLHEIAESKSNKHIAEIGMLRSAYLSKNYDNVISAAANVINNERSSQEQIREAHYNLAKAHYHKGHNIRALSIFERLSEEVTSYEGAEAKYMVAKINFVMKNDSIAEEVIYDFARMNSPQQYWIAQSFILLSDIFYQRNDIFSAKHTLQSILNNYTNEIDGIKDKASEKLTFIMEEEQRRKEEAEAEATEFSFEFSGDIMEKEKEADETTEDDSSIEKLHQQDQIDELREPFEYEIE